MVPLTYLSFLGTYCGVSLQCFHLVQPRVCAVPYLLFRTIIAYLGKARGPRAYSSESYQIKCRWLTALSHLLYVGQIERGAATNQCTHIQPAGQSSTDRYQRPENMQPFLRGCLLENSIVASEDTSSFHLQCYDYLVIACFQCVCPMMRTAVRSTNSRTRYLPTYLQKVRLTRHRAGGAPTNKTSSAGHLNGTLSDCIQPSRTFT